MSQQLLVESAPFTYQIVESGGDGRLVVRGEFARTDRPTRNNRLYPRKLWEREIEKLRGAMKARRCFGELDHPESGQTKLSRVSHLLLDLRIEGPRVIGEAEIVNTPNGRVLRALIEAGAQVGVSSRGFGTTRKLPNGMDEVQEDFKLYTFDFVADPAVQTAYPDVFREAHEKVDRVDSGNLTLEDMLKDYPGLLKALESYIVNDISRRVESPPVAESVSSDDDVRRVIAEERIRLAGEFAEQLERVKEETEMRVREELLSDDATAPLAALQEIARIVAIAAPVSDKDQRIAELEVELEAARRQIEEMKSVASGAALELHVEKRLAGNKHREAVLESIGDIASYGSIEELDDAIDAALDSVSGGDDDDEILDEILGVDDYDVDVDDADDSLLDEVSDDELFDDLSDGMISDGMAASEVGGGIGGENYLDGDVMDDGELEDVVGELEADGGVDEDELDDDELGLADSEDGEEDGGDSLSAELDLDDEDDEEDDEDEDDSIEIELAPGVELEIDLGELEGESVIEENALDFEEVPETLSENSGSVGDESVASETEMVGEEVSELKRELARAKEIARRAVLSAMIERAVAKYENADELREMCASASSKQEVMEIVERHGVAKEDDSINPAPIDEERVAKERAMVARGVARLDESDSGPVVGEHAAGTLAMIGMDVEQFRVLAGIK